MCGGLEVRTVKGRYRYVAVTG